MLKSRTAGAWAAPGRRSVLHWFGLRNSVSTASYRRGVPSARLPDQTIGPRPKIRTQSGVLPEKGPKTNHDSVLANRI